MTTPIEQLAAALDAEQAAERATAAERLARLGPACRDACVPLLRACGSDDATREWAAAALEAMGPPPAEKRGELIGLLEDPSDDVAYWAATLLGRLEDEATSACDPLARVIASQRSSAARERAVWAVQKIGCSSPLLSQALTTARESGSPRLVRLADDALHAD